MAWPLSDFASCFFPVYLVLAGPKSRAPEVPTEQVNVLPFNRLQSYGSTLSGPDIAIHGCRCPVHWRRYCIILRSNSPDAVPNPDPAHAMFVQRLENKEEMS
jgi:hypothetical protein